MGGHEAVGGQNLGCPLSGLWESDTVKGQNQTPEVQLRQSNPKVTAKNKKYILKSQKKVKQAGQEGRTLLEETA